MERPAKSDQEESRPQPAPAEQPIRDRTAEEIGRGGGEERNRELEDQSRETVPQPGA